MVIIETPRITTVLTLHRMVREKIVHRRNVERGPWGQGVYHPVGESRLNNAVLSGGGEAEVDLTVPVLEGLATPERTWRTCRRDQGHSGVFPESDRGSSACYQSACHFSGDKTISGGINLLFSFYDFHRKHLRIL